MIFFAAGGSWIPILIFIAFALLATWLKNKARAESADDYADLPRGPQQPRPEPRRKSWEEELREALENRPVPPPIPREAPPPLVYIPPPPVSEEDEGFKVYLPPPPPLAEAHFQPRAGLSESSERYEKASHLHERVARQLHDVTQRHVATIGTRPTIRSETAYDAIKMVRNPRQLRAAIVANIILGPPLALEPTQ